jgi:hypothetical protein
MIPDDNAHDGNEKIKVSRRRLLQLLAASGAVIGLEKLLPGKWITPRAEASPEASSPEIGDLKVYFRPVNGGATYNGTARFRYQDPMGNILSNAPFFAIGSMQGIIANGQPISSINGQYIPYNENMGTMRFPLPNPSFVNSTEKIELQIADSFNPSRQSNVIGNGFIVADYGQLNVSNLIVRPWIPQNDSSMPQAGAGGPKEAVFKYNGSLVNMISPNSTGIYAWLNSAGWISAGGSIANMGGVINPISNYGGEVRIPVGVVNNATGPSSLWLFLEDDSYPYESNDLSTTFTDDLAPVITDLDNALCSPSVQGSDIGCKYEVFLKYYDASGKMSDASRITANYKGQILIDDQSFAQLGVSVPNPVSGSVGFKVFIPMADEPNHIVNDLIVTLINDSGIASLEESTPIDEFCEPYFPVDLETQSASLVNNATGLWALQFAFNDTAGLLSNSALLFATVNSSSGVLTTIFNGYPLGNAGGLQINGTYPYYPNGSFNCSIQPIQPINATLGIGAFSFNYMEKAQAVQASLENLPTINWFLTQPSYRDSDVQQEELDSGMNPPDDDYKIYLPVTSG